TGGYLAPLPSDINQFDPFMPSDILPLHAGGFLLSGEGHVLKYDADGKLDSSFHEGLSNATVKQLQQSSAVGSKLVPTGDGKYILWNAVNIARIKADGSLDQAFGRLIAQDGITGLSFQSIALTSGNDVLVSASKQVGK